MDFSDIFPDAINIRDISLQNVASYDRFEQFALLANKYRNIFRHNYIDQSRFSVESTTEYFRTYGEQRSNRIMYVVHSGGKIIGQYGVRNTFDGYFLLDNAVRFDTFGGIHLFREVQTEILKLFRNVYPVYRPKIILRRDNLSSLVLHKFFNPEEFPESIYARDKFDKSVHFYAYLNLPSQFFDID